MAAFLKRALLPVIVVFCLFCGGCFMPFACVSLGADAAFNCANELNYTFLEDLSACGGGLWEDGDRGFNFKFIPQSNAENIFWGGVRQNGVPVRAYFRIYGDGEAHVYLPAAPQDPFCDYTETAELVFALRGGEITVKKIVYDELGIIPQNLRLVQKSLGAVLPREGGLCGGLADKNGVVAACYGGGFYYSARIRYAEDGLICTKDCYLLFDGDGYAKFCDMSTKEAVAEGRYDVVDYNTVQLHFGENGGLLAGNSALVLSGSYYNSFIMGIG